MAGNLTARILSTDYYSPISSTYFDSADPTSSFELEAAVSAQRGASSIVASVGDLLYASFCSPASGTRPRDGVQCSGAEPELLKVFAAQLNLTVQFLPLGSNEPWGSRMPNGSWNGHIGRILRGEADLAVGSITVTRARLAVVDFTKMVADYYYVLVAPETPATARYDTFLKPFGVRIWLLILFTLVCVTIADVLVNAVTEQVREDTNSSPKDKSFGKRIQGFMSAFVDSFTALSFSADDLPAWIKGLPASSVLLLGNWIVMSSFIGMIYSAVILAYLVAPGSNPGIGTLEQAVTQTRGRFVINKFDGSLNEYFSSSTSSASSVSSGTSANGRGDGRGDGRRILFKTIVDQNRLVTCDSDDPSEVMSCGRPGVDFVISSVREAEMFVANSSSNAVHVGKERFLTSTFAWPVSRGGSARIPRLREALDGLIGRAAAAGIIDELTRRERERYIRSNFQDANAGEDDEDNGGGDEGGDGGGGGGGSGEEESRVLGMEDCKGIFLVYGVGCASGLITLLLEVVIRKGSLKYAAKK